MNTTELTPLPARPNLEHYKKNAKDFVKACKSGDPDAIQRLRKYHPRSSRFSDSASGPAVGLTDAQLVLAREHGFLSWPKFAKHIEGLRRRDSPVSKFEQAADAIVNGDIATLKSLLRENPELIRARSPRVHRSMLIHYLGANGFEGYRQKSPENAVQIAKILLDAGAEVDAEADTYGKGTTLGLVATSIHPKLAGVQIKLMQTLIDAGASVDSAQGRWNPLVSALHNGRPEAAEYLAERGARLDLEGAAGVGRLDVVKSHFNEDGTLKATATKEQMETGFMWACEYGRNDVVEFLLRCGMDLRAQANTGLTGLHWAVVGGQVETIRLLLKHGAPLEELNVYGGTPLGQALWCIVNGDPSINCVPAIETLLEAGAQIEPGSLGWLALQKISSTVKSRVDKALRRYGAKS